MNLISNWTNLKRKIKQIFLIRKEDEQLSIHLTNFNTLKLNDPLLKKFLDQVNLLGEEILKKLFNTNNVEQLPVDFIEHGDMMELKFTDEKLFKVTHALLESLFHGDLVRDVLTGDRRSYKHLLNKLENLP